MGAIRPAVGHHHDRRPVAHLPADREADLVRAVRPRSARWTSGSPISCSGPSACGSASTGRNDRYLLAERADPDDRLFYYEKRVRVGAIIGLARWLFTDITGGYSFDRFYFEGESYSDRNQNRIDVDSGPSSSSGWA
jgi:hypothetical protein